MEEDTFTNAAESVWSFRGYKLSPSEFTTAMVHFFRAEINRSNVWRRRLDATTNWAVVTTGAAISISFTTLEAFPNAILLNILLISMFLWIEARRYRYYELWSERVRLLETDFFAAMLVPPFAPSADWAESLAESLLQPSFPISMLEAVGRRVRRNYWWLFLVVLLAWTGKLYLHPQLASTFEQLVSRAAIGPIAGWAIFLIGVLYVCLFLMIGLLTVGLHASTGEVLPRFLGEQIAAAKEQDDKRFIPWFRRSNQRQQLIALIITSQAEKLSQRIFQALKRGATQLSGMGMYTGKARNVLLCALTVTEVNHLKTLVKEEDPAAFVVISPAQEVFGRGFTSLPEEE